MLTWWTRLVQDELYLQSFEVYSEETFIFIICSERGKGKSVRTERMSALLPEDTVGKSGAASARAGMNGTLTSIAFDLT